MRYHTEIYKEINTGDYVFMPFFEISDFVGSAPTNHFYELEKNATPIQIIETIQKCFKLNEQIQSITKNKMYDYFKFKHKNKNYINLSYYELVGVNFYPLDTIAPLDDTMVFKAGYKFTVSKRSEYNYVGEKEQYFLPLTATPEEVGQAVLDAFKKCEEINKNRKF